MAELNPIEKHLLDKTAEANYGLWNALLTVNGILISAFSVLLTIKPQTNKTLITILVTSCAISLFLIICNYLITKWHYKKVGQLFSPSYQKLTDEQKQSDIDKSRRWHRFIVYSENISLLLLFLEMVLVLYIVFSIEKSHLTCSSTRIVRLAALACQPVKSVDRVRQKE